MGTQHSETLILNPQRRNVCHMHTECNEYHECHQCIYCHISLYKSRVPEWSSIKPKTVYLYTCHMHITYLIWSDTRHIHTHCLESRHSSDSVDFKHHKIKKIWTEFLPNKNRFDIYNNRVILYNNVRAEKWTKDTHTHAHTHTQYGEAYTAYYTHT